MTSLMLQVKLDTVEPLMKDHSHYNNNNDNKELLYSAHLPHGVEVQFRAPHKHKQHLHTYTPHTHTHTEADTNALTHTHLHTHTHTHIHTHTHQKTNKPETETAVEKTDRLETVLERVGFKMVLNDEEESEQRSVRGQSFQTDGRPPLMRDYPSVETT